MVVGIIGKVLPLVALGLGMLFLGNIFTRPAAASSGALALLDTGTAVGGSLSSIGTGVGDLGGGIGTGLSGLLKPFWEIKNLVSAYSSDVAGAANVSPVGQYQVLPSASALPQTITASSGSDSPATTSTPSVSHTGWSAGISPTATIGGVTFGGQTGWGL